MNSGTWTDLVPPSDSQGLCEVSWDVLLGKAVKDIGNNNPQAKHAKGSSRDSFSLSFQCCCLYDFIITIMTTSKNQLRRGCTCTEHSAKTKWRRVPASLILQQLQQMRPTKCTNVRGWNTAGGAKCLLFFLIIPIKWFFFLLNHILWLKSQALLWASIRTHSSLKKSNKSNPQDNLEAKLPWAAEKPCVDPSLAAHCCQASHRLLLVLRKSCSVCLWMLFDDFPVSSDARITLVNYTPEQTLSSWLKI